jgi:hypothetical protein
MQSSTIEFTMNEVPSFKFLDLKDRLWHECLEESYGFLRESWQGDWLRMPMVLHECLSFLNLHESHFSMAGKSMLDAAKSVAIEIENKNKNQTKYSEPKYHNRLHFADALTSMSIQLAILVELEERPDYDWLACALLTCIAHDFVHPGKVNRHESEIEKQSFDFLKPILSINLVPDNWQKIIEIAIVRSDFSIVHKNHAQVTGQDFEWNLKWLCVLLNEADVMASASAKYGPELGESLAQEWRLIGFMQHTHVASLEARKSFLKNLLFSSPASLVLGLSERISNEIAAIY